VDSLRNLRWSYDPPPYITTTGGQREHEVRLGPSMDGSVPRCPRQWGFIWWSGLLRTGVTGPSARQAARKEKLPGRKGRSGQIGNMAPIGRAHGNNWSQPGPIGQTLAKPPHHNPGTGRLEVLLCPAGHFVQWRRTRPASGRPWAPASRWGGPEIKGSKYDDAATYETIRWVKKNGVGYKACVAALQYCLLTNK
jgi:hypothetical protein